MRLQAAECVIQGQTRILAVSRNQPQVLAARYDVDLGSAFDSTRDDLEKRLRSDVRGREALEHELADCLWSVLA